MQTPPTLPEGHVPCPRCGTAVLPDAPVCPNCGERLGRAPAGRRRNTGIIILLVGLALAVLGGGGFFVGCIAAMGNSGQRNGILLNFLLQVCLGAGVLGVGMMVVGFIMALVQAVRR